jgi:putative spermidine/putrescine transport system ATP-binding protein
MSTSISPPVAVIRLKNLANRRTGLRDVSFEVAEGEVVSLLGSLGRDVLLTLAGLVRDQSGEIIIKGRLLRRTPSHRRSAGVVFSGDNLFPQLSLTDNLALPLRARGLARGERAARIAEVLALFDLQEVAHRRPLMLPMLQRRQAALARALVFGPAVLLLDEPFADLDPQPRAILQQQLLAVIRANRLTVLIATSDWRDAMAMSDRIGVLAGGAIVQLGPPEELYERPFNADVAFALGETNRLDGVLRDIEDDVAVVALNCGPLVEAVRGEPLAVGQRCLVHVRPERVAIAAARAADIGPDAIAAVLQQITHLGDHIRMSVSVGSARLVVHRPAGSGLAGLLPGREVAIAWQRSHATVFGERAFADLEPFV